MTRVRGGKGKKNQWYALYYTILYYIQFNLIIILYYRPIVKLEILKLILVIHPSYIYDI